MWQMTKREAPPPNAASQRLKWMLDVSAPIMHVLEGVMQTRWVVGLTILKIENL